MCKKTYSKEDITVIIPTHLCKGASIQMLHVAVSSLEERLGLRGCKCVVHYDVKDQSDLSINYAHSLVEWFARIDSKVIFGHDCGMAGAVRCLFGCVHTPLYILLEHDWQFIRDVDMDKLLHAFSAEDVNYVRFNKRKNVIALSDETLKLDLYHGLPLLRTDNWSNNPHIGKTKTFKEWWINLITEVSTASTGVEQRLVARYRLDIREMGFLNASKKWGVYIYGAFNDPAIVKHLDGNKYMPSSDKGKA